jgi:uncharacterized protein YraI
MRILFAAALAALTITPAVAEPTARVSGGNIAVRTGPGSFYPVVARIPNGTNVTLEYCTRDDRWCFVTAAPCPRSFPCRSGCR